MEITPMMWRLFMWCCDVMDHFFSFKSTRVCRDTRVERYKNGTDLCQFVRTILLGSVVLVLSTATYLVTIFCVVVLPFVLFSTLGIIKVIAIVAGVIIGVVGAAVAIYWVCRLTYLYFSNRPKSDQSDQIGPIGIVFAYIHGWKNYFCPLVRPPREQQS